MTAWVATGSKIASIVALMKVLLHALGPWSSGTGDVTSPGWIMVVAVLSAASMTYGNFAALAQKNFKRMLAYSSIAHAGYMLVGVAAAGVSKDRGEAAGSVLFYLVVYAFGNIGAFALAAWLARDKDSDEIEDLNGLGVRHPALAVCVLLLMLSLIGMPPLGGFFGKLYMFMEALDETVVGGPARMTLIWLVALGLLNSVVSAFYYVRRAQGDVPPARVGYAGVNAAFVSRGVDRAGDGRLARVRDLPRPADLGDEVGRVPDALGERVGRPGASVREPKRLASGARIRPRLSTPASRPRCEAASA